MHRLAHHLRLALLGLRRDLGLTLAMFVCLTLGAGLWTMGVTQHVQEKSVGLALPADLHQVELPHERALALGRAVHAEVTNYYTRTRVTYPEFQRLSQSGLPTRQTGTYRTRLLVAPVAPGASSAAAAEERYARFVSADFFSLFQVPLARGRTFTRDEERERSAVVVVSRKLAETHLASTGHDLLGATLVIEGRDFRCIGVLAEDQPNMPLWDLTFTGDDQDQLYLPFTLGTVLKSWPEKVAFQSPAPQSLEGLLQSDAVFLAFWIDLPDENTRASYAAYLHEQFEARGIPPQLRAAAAWRAAFPPPTGNAWVFTSLLAVALLGAGSNATRLLLARGARRREDIGLHRALGATRVSVFAAQMLEASLIALAAALAGLAVGASYNALYNQIALESDIPVRMNGLAAVLAVVPSFAVGLLAALYPSWRLSRVAPTVSLRQGRL